MCAIHNPLFSALTLLLCAIALVLLPPAIAILSSSFYRGESNIYGETGAVRIFITLMLLVFLGMFDSPWQLARAAFYYSAGVEVAAVVVQGQTESGYRVPFYQYRPPFPASAPLISADASLKRRHNSRESSFNWLHAPGDSVTIRVSQACPQIAWTRVQDLSLLTGLLPLIGIIALWLVPAGLLQQRTASDDL